MAASAILPLASTTRASVARTTVGAFLLPVVAVPASIYGASVGIGIDNHYSTLVLLTPAIFLAGAYLFPLTIAAVIGGWVASFAALAAWYAARLIIKTWFRLVISPVVASVLIAVGATVGFELLASAPSPIVAEPVDPLAGQSAQGVFLGTTVSTLALSFLIALLTNFIARSRR